MTRRSGIRACAHRVRVRVRIEGGVVDSGSSVARRRPAVPVQVPVPVQVQVQRQVVTHMVTRQQVAPRHAGVWCVAAAAAAERQTVRGTHMLQQATRVWA